MKLDLIIRHFLTHTTQFSTTLARHILLLEQLEQIVERSRVVCVRSAKYIVTFVSVTFQWYILVIL
jgi:hypothetical protein